MAATGHPFAPPLPLSVSYFSLELPIVLLTLSLFPNSASAQSLHGATPLPCQSQGSHRGQSWIGLDRVCQTGGPIPRSAAERTAPLSSASWGSPAHCGRARWTAVTLVNLHQKKTGERREVRGVVNGGMREWWRKRRGLKRVMGMKGGVGWSNTSLRQIWREKFEQSMDSNEPQWADLGLSDSIDCGDSEKMLYKCNPLPSIRCLSFLISQKYTLASHIYTLLRPSCRITHTHTHRHTNIYCCGISIRLWALVSCSYCKAEGLNETIIRTLKSRGPQMIRKERTREKDKEKKGMRVKIPRYRANSLLQTAPESLF